MMESKTIGFNDDVLMEVLAFLPPKSVFRFKSVSPHWRDLLSSPAFLRRYAAVHRHDDHLVAFFQKVGLHETSDTMFAKHCNVLPRYKDGDYIKIPRHVGRFLSSSNGLVLCSHSRGTVVTYHVGNPLTGKFVELPLPWHGKNCLILDGQRLDKYDRVTSTPCRQHNYAPLVSAVLICKKSNMYTPPVYTVLRAGKHYSWLFPNRILYIDSYSSESGEWTSRTRKLVATDGDFALSARMPPVVANGVVHWYTRSGDIVVYDPECDDQHAQLIKVPHHRKDKNICYAVTRSADDDVLWLAVLRRRNLLFYMLPKEGGYKHPVNIDSKEWVLMRDVSILSISKLMKKGLIAGEECTLECLISESGSEVVAVLQQEETLFLYNVHRKSIVKLDYSDRCNIYYAICPYLQSSFLSSYCL